MTNEISDLKVTMVVVIDHRSVPTIVITYNTNVFYLYIHIVFIKINKQIKIRVLALGKVQHFIVDL